MPLQPIIFDEKDLKKLFKSDTPSVRLWRRTKRLWHAVTWFSIIFASSFAALNANAFWQRASFAIEEPKAAPLIALPAVRVSYEPEILIPKIGVQAPVIYEVPYGNIIEFLRSGVVRYEGTATPGQVGNVVLLGHSSDYPWSDGRYKTIFALLDKLTTGDEIILPYGADRYVYRVTQVSVVRPTDLTVLQRTANPTVTLISCYPIGTALNRIIIRAALTEGPVGPIQETEPFSGDNLTPAR